MNGHECNKLFFGLPGYILFGLLCRTCHLYSYVINYFVLSVSSVLLNDFSFSVLFTPTQLTGVFTHLLIINE